LKEGLYMGKVGRKILFDGCNYDCFNCTYPDCYCPDRLVEKEISLERQQNYLRKARERAMRSYERRRHKND
jgi:hypothetical protein